MVQVSSSSGRGLSHLNSYKAEYNCMSSSIFVKLYKRDCKTIQAAQRRVNRVMNKHIKYYTVTFCFIHGGKKFKARGEEKRSSS